MHEFNPSWMGDLGDRPATGIDAGKMNSTADPVADVPDFKQLSRTHGKRLARFLTSGGVDRDKEAALLARKDREEREAKAAANALLEEQMSGPYGARPETQFARDHAAKHGFMPPGWAASHSDGLPNAGPALVRAITKAGSYINSRMQPIYDPADEPETPSGHGVLVYTSGAAEFRTTGRGDVKVRRPVPRQFPSKRRII